MTSVSGLLEELQRIRKEDSFHKLFIKAQQVVQFERRKVHKKQTYTKTEARRLL